MHTHQVKTQKKESLKDREQDPSIKSCKNPEETERFSNQTKKPKRGELRSVHSLNPKTRNPNTIYTHPSLQVETQYKQENMKGKEQQCPTSTCCTDPTT